MKDYFRKRLSQPSTWIGFATAATALLISGGTVTPAIAISLLASLGLIHTDEVQR